MQQLSATGCSSVTIPDSVTEIGYNAFYRCSSLASVTIPDEVTKIGYEAFRGCLALPTEERDAMRARYGGDVC
eukprot:SAG22_NODE_914_length_6519_cov_1.701713_2_plen_73_part_00